MNPFVAHMVGDFILQNDWMARNKKLNPIACAVHSVVYLMPFLLTHLQWWQLILIGLQHFAQDHTEFVFWWMRDVKRVPQEQWGLIPLWVDQSLHILWIQIVLLLA